MTLYLCDRCGKAFTHEPIRSETEVKWVGAKIARTWCSTECADRDSEEIAERQQ